jgi:hypothetical protein
MVMQLMKFVDYLILINIPAGSYTCTITDAFGCSISTPTYVINNNAGSLVFDLIDVDNEICSNNLGEIELFFSGGTAPFTFLWNTGATTQNLYAISAGTYSCTISDASGCQLSTGNLLVVNESGTLNLDNLLTLDETCGNATGLINITVSGGANPLSYLWSNGSTSEDLSNLSAGNYSAVVTDSNGCQINVSATINNDPGILAVDNIIITNENCGQTDGALNLIISGETLPVNYTWSSGQTTEDLSGIPAGNYAVDVVDANGCTVSGNATVINNSGTLSLTGSQVVNEICLGTNGAIDITVTGTAPITYLWSNGATTEDLSGISAGTYSCVITDSSGCIINTGPYTINNGTGSFQIALDLLTDEICNNNLGAIDISIVGGSSPFTILWSNGATTEDISSLAAGTYTVDITDATGCVISETYTINNQPGTLSIDNILVTDEVCSNTNGAIDITVSGGTTPYSFVWSSGPTTEDISGLSQNTYSVVVSDNGGCSLTSSIIAVNNNSGSFNLDGLNVSHETCGDTTGNIDIIVSGAANPVTYLWSNGSTNQDLSNVNSGTYTGTATDANGCVLSFSGTVLNDPGNIVVTDSITDITCGLPNGAINLTVTGAVLPLSYVWSNGATTEDISGLAAGNYINNISDAAGCIYNYSGNVGSIGALTTSVVSVDETCGNGDGSITVTANGGTAPYTFSWIGGAPSACCDYTLEMFDQGNSWNGASVTVLIDGTSIGNFTVPFGGANTEIFEVCDGESIELLWNAGGFDNEVSFNLLDASGATIFSQGASPTPGSLFTGTGSCTSGNSNTSSLTNLSAGTYTCTVSDDLGCVVSNTVTINNNNTFTTSSNVIADTCNASNGVIDLTLTGGTTFTFVWSNGATTEDIFNIAAGTYSVTITEAGGCVVQDTFTVNNINTYSVAGVITSDSCSAGNGSIDITLTGGSSPFTFIWSNGATTEDVAGLSMGSYNVTITDAGGCTVTDTFVVNSTSTFTESGTVTDDACNTGVGAIDVTISGGSGPFTFIWSNGATTEDISGLSAGTFTVTITDATGCSGLDTFVVNNISTFSVASVVTKDSCSLSNGTIDISLTGGLAPFTFSWSNGATTEDLTGLSSGAYNVTITDASGCSDYASFIVSNNSSFTVADIITDDTCNLGNGAIDLTLTSTNPCCSYVLNMYDANNNGWGGNPIPEVQVYINGSPVGTYTIPPGNGNSMLTEFIPVCDGETISVEYLPGGFNNNNSYDLYDATGNLLFADGPNPTGPGIAYTTTVSCPASTPTATFVWNTGATSEDITNLTTGTYTVTITETGGCTILDTFTVNNVATFNIFGTVTADSCSANIGAIDLTTVGGSSPFSFLWSNGATTEDVSGLSSGTYTVTVTDNSGCSDVASFVINNTSVFSTSSILTSDTCNAGVGAIDLSLSGGASPYTYSWSNGATTEDISGLAAGTYSVIITDAAGCIGNETFLINNTSIYSAFGTVTNDSCNFGNGAIDLTLTGGSSPFTFSWSNGATTEDIVNLTTGTYNVIITDASGCINNDSFFVNNSTSSFTTSGIIIDDTCSLGNGAIDLILNVTNPCCTYTLDMQDQGNSWNGASIDVLVDGILIGNFTVFGGGANTETFTVCDGESIELLWNSGTWDNEVSFDLIDASGTIVFSQGASPTPGSIYTGTASCPSANPTVTYSWSNGATTEDITNLTAGTYTVTIIETGGCTVFNTFVVNNVSTYSVTETVIDDNCNASVGAIDLTLSGGSSPYSFVWSNGATTEDITGLSSGIYTVTISDATGCLVIDTFNVNSSATYTTSSIITNDSCSLGTGAVDINITGGSTPFTFSWSNGATTEDIAGLSSGSYIVTITDAVGCMVVDTFVINNSSIFTSTASITVDSCSLNNGAIDLILTGGTAPFTFVWSNGATTEDISNLSTGTYNVSITDATGCSDIASFFVNSISSIAVSGIVSDDSCNVGNGAIDISVNAANPCCTYTLDMVDSFNDGWDGASIDVNINGSLFGNFTVPTGGNTVELIPVCDGDLLELVYYAGNFENEHSYTLIDGSGTTIFTATAPPATGSVYLANVNCPAPPPIVTYSWSTGSTSEDISNLTTGTYIVTVTESGGCTVIDTFVVNNVSTLSVSGIVNDDTCNVGVGAINLNPIGGSTPYTFSWSNGATTEDIANLTVGTYTATVTDASGCSDVVTFAVNNIATFSTSGIVTDDSCSLAIGGVDLTVTGGSTPYTFSWSNGASTEDLSGLSSGAYTVTITDASGCTDVVTFIVNNNSTFTSSGIITNASCGTCADGGIDITATGDAPFTYAWSTGSTLEDVSGLLPGVYYVIITGSTGCSDSLFFTIIYPNTIVELSTNWFINVYPNPTKGEFTVDYNFNGYSNVTFLVSNILGEIVHQDLITNKTGKIKVDTENMNPGIYFLQLMSENKRQTVKLIIAR